MAQKILLAEDDGMLRETLAEALRAEGYEVLAVANGQQALEAVDAELPAAIILDCLMPKMAGFDVAKVLKAKIPSVPLLFITGVFKSAAQQQEAREKYGARAYLTKPFEPRRLVDTLKPLLFSGAAAAPAAASVQAAQPSAAPLPESGNLLENPVLYLAWRASREGHSGALELFGEHERARIFLLKGRAAFAQHSDVSLNVGVELLRAGVLSAETYKQACDLAVERATGLFDVIKGEGFAGEAELKLAYKTLIPKVLERVVALTGRFRFVAGDGFASVLPTSPQPLLEPLLAGLRKTSERDVEAHVAPRRPLRLAPGDTWAEVVGRLAEACGTDSLARAINGRATIAQMVEASPNPTERASRCRQVYMLMSTMAVRASMEPIAMAGPAPQPPPVRQAPPEPAPVAAAPRPAPAPIPVAASVAAPPMEVERPEHTEVSGPMRAAPMSKADFEDLDDGGVMFTPDEEVARQRISAKLDEIDGKDFFAVLGVKRGTDAAGVKKAYFGLARDFHTDAFAGLNLGTAQKKLDHVFQTIQTAYATLTDDRKRGEYEAKLAYEDQGASTDVAAILAAEAEMHKARLLVDRGEMAGALKLVDKVLAVSPKNDEALGCKLYCAWWQGRNAAEVPGVVKQLEQHYKAQPGALHLKEFQGWLWIEAGDFKAARISFKRVLEMDAQHAGANRGMRTIVRKQEEAEKKNSGLGKFLKR